MITREQAEEISANATGALIAVVLILLLAFL